MQSPRGKNLEYNKCRRVSLSLHLIFYSTSLGRFEPRINVRTAPIIPHSFSCAGHPTFATSSSISTYTFLSSYPLCFELAALLLRPHLSHCQSGNDQRVCRVLACQGLRLTASEMHLLQSTQRLLILTGSGRPFEMCHPRQVLHGSAGLVASMAPCTNCCSPVVSTLPGCCVSRAGISTASMLTLVVSVPGCRPTTSRAKS
ncbi:hypothetical protein J3F83DRAFT_153346 [Trichoderma novae-zelandiae]